jgi:hypothetical protein
MRTTSQCRRCRMIKSLEEFKKADKHLCLLCHRASVKEWKEKNPEKAKEQRRRKDEKKKRANKEKRDLKNQRRMLIRCLKKVRKEKKRLDAKSYRFILVDGKAYPEHRYIMEQHLGRKLEWGEEVHHINHIRNDNRIENLVVMWRTEHRALHARIRAGLDA